MIIAKIHNVFKTLTNTEQRIAAYILKFPDKVVDMTVKELAQACDTVPSAVNRTCKAVGAEGFSKLKILLAADVVEEGVLDHIAPLNKDDTPKIVFGKVFNSGINALKNTYNMLDFSKVETISKKIAAAKRVFIFGVGTSSVIAIDAAYRFSQLGVHAYAYTDILQMNLMAKNMEVDDVAFCISHSGTTKAVVNAMRFAKDRGATTIALSSFINGLLYQESDYAISVFADEENYPVEAVSARIAHMCIVDALMMSIASLNYDDYLEHIIIRNEALDEIRY